MSQKPLTYADAGKNRFAAVWGSARCEHNEAKARDLWNIHAKGWWPDGLYTAPTDQACGEQATGYAVGPSPFLLSKPQNNSGSLCISM